VKHSEALDQLAPALAAAQLAMRPALKDAQNPHLRNKYADLGSCWDACRDPLTRNGLSILQPVEVTEIVVIVTTILLHASGQWVSSELALPWSESKGITHAQAIGSVITYGRRYGLSSMVGIITDDDDGANAGAKPKAAPAQRREEPREPAATPNGEHHPSWEADRTRFCAELGRLGMKYDDVAAALHGRGRSPSRPSAMDQTTRAALLVWLSRPEGQAAVAGTAGGAK
jgi:hypothetical protein